MSNAEREALSRLRAAHKHRSVVNLCFRNRVRALTGVRTPANVLYMTTTTNTATATSAYGTVREVTISAKGLVHTNGVLLGDVEGMERLGWEFAR